MKNYRLLLGIILLLLIGACEKEDIQQSNSSNETLIFGLSYGFCLGDECVRLFKIEDGELFAEAGVERLRLDEPIPFQTEALPEQDYERALPLLNDFPELLTTAQDTIYGSPDAADQGSIFLQWQSEDINRFWLLDTRVDALPEELRNYAERVKTITEELSE
jgi:hypothetical protein